MTHEIISGAGREVTRVLYEPGDPEYVEREAVIDPGEIAVREEVWERCPNVIHYLGRFWAGDLGKNEYESEEELKEREDAIKLKKPVHGYYHLEGTDWLHISVDAERTKTIAEMLGGSSAPSRLEVTYPASYNLEAIGGRRGIVRHYEETFGCRLESDTTIRGDLRIQERMPISE